MASAAKTALASTRSNDGETIVDFSLEELRAPFPLRCGALCIDYILLIAVPAIWLTIGRFFSDGGLPTLGFGVFAVGALLFFANSIALPLVGGQSLGKFVVGITVVGLDGTRVNVGRMILRNTVGYFLTILTAGTGFLVAAINSSGRSLHDLLGNTVVIKGRKKQL